MFCALFLVFYFIVSIAAKCPPGSVQFYSDNTLCLNFNATKTYYLDAEEVCKNLGGHLTSVHKPVDNMFLSQQALVRFNKSTDDDFWFGANDFISPPNWSWMDGTPFDFKYWDKGQPQNVSGSDCGAVLMQGGKWRAVDCYMQKPFVCTVPSLDALTTTTIVTTPKTTTSKPKSCTDSWTFYETTGFCYKVFIENATWLEAEERCKVDYAHLASIHNSNENNFITQLATFHQSDCDWSKEPWIGLITEDENKQWKWTDGTPFDYNNWLPGQPDYPGIENCGEMIITSQCSIWTPGTFNNWPCKTLNARFVCKRSP
uniref:C-type lectin domain-containing protein n=1 Tax=Panagrolaimus sp. PS1159 TaxID=55785 RepID=A0AC35GI39_9BILA